MDGKSRNIVGQYIEQIKEILPSVIIEDTGVNDTKYKIDMEKLSILLGKTVIPSDSTDYNNKYNEHFSFEWNGKRRSIAEAQKRSSGTLLPCLKDSLNWDKTNNLYIEGDNLEVLKLLQDSYLNSIKLIYIDPPYNTGKDFVYKDNYKDNISNYLEQTNTTNAVNSETSGRYHTNWLNMMYPRLVLARNLLKSDGVICISIDDNELANLRIICDEIFGEDNFRNIIIVRRYDKNLNRQFMDNGLRSFNVGVEYILCYAKSNDFSFNPIFKESSEERQSVGYWKGFWNDANRPTMRYDILGVTPETGQWKWKEETAIEAVENYKNYIENYSNQMTLEEYWEKTGKKLKFIRRNPNGKGKNLGVENWIAPSDGILRNSNWSDFLASKNDTSTKGLFDFPKNVDLIKSLIEATTSDNDIILDFFSGSGTTAHAVMKLNAEEQTYRKFICVQLPEKTPDNSDAKLAGYNNIADIAKERIKVAGKNIIEEYNIDINNNNDYNFDYGYKVFKLNYSNVLEWDVELNYTNEKEAGNILSLEFNKVLNIVKENRTEFDLLYEVMLKLGLELSTHVSVKEVHNKKVFLVGYGVMIASFAKELNYSDIVEMIELKPDYINPGEFKVVLADESFASNNDKVNIMQLLRQKNITNIEII